MPILEAQFHHAIINVADFANSLGFGIRFRQMIQQYGSIETAKRLLTSHEIQTGLMRLWVLDCLDQSMEALVIQEHFLPLFTEAEIAEAHRRIYNRWAADILSESFQNRKKVNYNGRVTL